MIMQAPIFIFGLSTLVACGGIAIVDGDFNEGGGGTTSSSSTGPGGGSLVVAVDTATARNNCQPVIAPDPLKVTIDATVSNVGTVAATTTIGTVVLTSASLGSISFTVTPNSVGPLDAGQSQQVTFEKVDGSASGPLDGCDLCNANDLSVEIGGSSATVNSIACVF